MDVEEGGEREGGPELLGRKAVSRVGEDEVGEEGGLAGEEGEGSGV